MSDTLDRLVAEARKAAEVVGDALGDLARRTA